MAFKFMRRDWVYLAIILCLLGTIAGISVFNEAVAERHAWLERELKKAREESGFYLPADGTWRASEEHGDKPGIGFDITRAGDKITGFGYIIDPNKPGDFSAEHSVKIPLEISRADDKVIDFTVQWNDSLKDQMILEPISPIGGKSFVGVLSNFDHPENRQIVLNFVRLPESVNTTNFKK
jgi:hypothetical protein